MSVTIEMIDPHKCRPNPYRHERYEISEEKIEALLASYEQSGFWDGSIQARRRKGEVEIAFGHHRVEAARRAGIPKIGVVVADRDNETMLRMMADENRQEFKHDALVAVETIAAVVEAYGRGEIELEVPEGQHGKGPQTGFFPVTFPGGKVGGYTLLTVARFLRWTKANGTQASSACRAAFDAYRERASTEEALNTIPVGQRSEVAVSVVVDAAKVARVAAQQAGFTPAKVRDAEVSAAKTAAKRVAEEGGFRARDMSAEIGWAAVREIAGPKKKTGPDIEVYLTRVIAKCERATTPYARILTECRRLIPFVDDLEPKKARALADALVEMLRRDAEGVRGVVGALRSGDKKALKKALEA